MKVLTNARVYCYDPFEQTYSRHDGIILDGVQIRSLDPAQAGAGIERVDLQGATVLPAFADCHVHLTDTGYFLNERNLEAVRSYAEFADAVARIPRGEFVLAGQFDESKWRDGAGADAAPLEKNFPDSLAMLVRIDGHSSLVNRKTLTWLDLPAAMRGVEIDDHGGPTGKLTLEANWHAQMRFMKELPVAARRDAERRATMLALERGYLHLHVQFVGFAREEYAREIQALKALPRAKWYPKICEPDPALARDLGLPFVGGDVFLDGSIGSCTAAVNEPFSGTRSHGELRYSDDEVYVYFANAEALGISAGVHAIGDRAIEQCIATWERVLGGKPSTHSCRHFIEHFEIALPEHIEACARLGIYLSMQPQFDALWGGRGRMYAERLGPERMRTMNALRRIQSAGGVLCGGDDSPVCNLSPLEGLQAAVDHHEPAERLTAQQALTMYTYNAARLAHAEQRTGILAPGFAADLVILDRDPLDGAAFADCSVLETWGDGECRSETSGVFTDRRPV